MVNEDRDELGAVILKQMAKIQLLEMENNSLKDNLEKAADDAVSWRQLALSKPILPPPPPTIIFTDAEGIYKLKDEIALLKRKLKRRAWVKLFLNGKLKNK